MPIIREGPKFTSWGNGYFQGGREFALRVLIFLFLNLAEGHFDSCPFIFSPPNEGVKIGSCRTFSEQKVSHLENPF